MEASARGRGWVGRLQFLVGGGCGAVLARVSSGGREEVLCPAILQWLLPCRAHAPLASLRHPRVVARLGCRGDWVTSLAFARPGCGTSNVFLPAGTILLYSACSVPRGCLCIRCSGLRCTSGSLVLFALYRQVCTLVCRSVISLVIFQFFSKLCLVIISTMYPSRLMASLI